MIRVRSFSQLPSAAWIGHREQRLCRFLYLPKGSSTTKTTTTTTTTRTVRSKATGGEGGVNTNNLPTTPILASSLSPYNGWRNSSNRKSSHNHHHWIHSGGILLTAAAAPTMMTVSCESGRNTSATTTTTTGENPLWPSGVSEEDVDAFVDAILRDSTINMSTIPDVVERSLYKFTVQITCNLIYRALSSLEGVEFLAHAIQLDRRRPATTSNSDWSLLLQQHAGINDDVLEDIADRFLENPSINQSLVPDYVERQLYKNCLKIIFHLLDAIAATFCITLCGHELRVHFEPSAKQYYNYNAMNEKGRGTKKGTSSSATRVTTEQLQKLLIAQRQQQQSAAAASMSREDGSNNMSSPSTDYYQDFQSRLEASLYGLVLGIVDDFLANTEIQILSDRIWIDIVPLGEQEQTAAGASSSRNNSTEGTKGKTSDSRSAPDHPDQNHFLVPFSLGVGVGGTLVAAAAVAVMTFTSSTRGGE